jgi:serine/threonine protein kinase
MDDSFKLVGSALEDRYRVDGVIGEGGFGVVYRGYHLRLEHPIAIKCLKIPGHFTAEARDLFLARFREEGRILVKLADAPGVPRVYDYGVAELPGGVKVPFLVLEWLDGQTLEDALRTRRTTGLGGLSATEALALILPAVDAIGFAHAHQIAHRDIKPANMFLVRGTKGQTMKVLDFGIAKAMQEGEALAQAKTQTATNFRAFTPNYAAAEQFAPKRYGASGPWTDVHALGLILLEMLTGAQANRGEDLVECLEFATAESRPSAQGRGVKVSDALEAVLAKALARSPEGRFQNAEAFAEALRATPEGREVPSMKTGPGLGPLPDPVPLTERGEPLATGASPRLSGGTTPIASITPLGSPTASPSPAGPNTAGSGTLIAGAVAPTRLPGNVVAVTNVDIPDPARGPAPPPKATSGGSRVPVIAGLAGLLAVGGAAALYTMRDSTSGSDGNATGSSASSSASAAADAEKSEVVYSVEYVEGRDHIVPVRLSKSDVEGKAHYALTLRGGKVVAFDKVAPSGTVLESAAVKFQPDGGWVRTKTNARQVVIETVTQTKDGLQTNVNRFGYPFSLGCARSQLVFDDKGNVTKRLCQDAEGHVIIDKQGCQAIVAKSNERGQFTEFQCQLEDGTPIKDANGVYSRRFTYDDKGRLMESSFYSTDGTSTSDSSGCARNRNTYDAAWNVLEQQCIGPTGMVTPFASSTIVAIRRKSDANGCLVEETFVDQAGSRAAIGPVGGRVFGRNERCEELSIGLVDVTGKLVSAPGQVTLLEREYDGEGNNVRTKCLDAARKPMNCQADSASGENGSVLSFTYDDKGRTLSEKAFDAAGKPTITQRNYPHESRNAYNDLGQIVETRYFDAEGKPATVLGKVSLRRYRYDSLGAEISNASFGVDEQPVDATTGLHEIRRTYDDRHRLASVELRDAGGGPPKKVDLILGGVNWPNRAVKLAVVRNGTIILNEFFDAKGTSLSKIDCSVPTTPCER